MASKNILTSASKAIQAEEIYFLRAECLFHLEFYIEAAYHYEQFAVLYPNSELAQRALYLAAYSNYKNSPDITHSQNEAESALIYLQDFVDMYPKSALLDSANYLMDELRARLERKMYNWANLYYKMDYYSAAATAFDLFLKDFPETNYREEVLYKIVRSQYFFARGSVPARKAERLRDMQENADYFLREYPESRYSLEVKNFLHQSKRYLNNAL